MRRALWTAEAWLVALGACAPGVLVSCGSGAQAAFEQAREHEALLNRALAAAATGRDELSVQLAEAREHFERELVRVEAEREAAVREREAALAEAAREAERLTEQVAELTAELAARDELRIDREREWLAFTRAISVLEVASVPDELRFEVDPELAAELDEAQSAAQAAEAEPAPDPVEARSAEIDRALRTLLAVDGLRGMDLLESGRLGEGWVGPVVFRLVDGQGRLAGSLWAERMWLEASRSARTVTLVLEDGYETWHGGRTEFDRPDLDPRAPSVRRAVLPRVDPKPWLEALPELFPETDLEREIDDGMWSAPFVQVTLNELLRRDAGWGYYKLKTLGGVKGDVLREVHLEGYDAEGRIERHLFADRLRVVPQEKGVLLQLEDGAQMRGDDKATFLDGRFRIFLPRADLEEWIARGIPGAASVAPGEVESAMGPEPADGD